MPPLSPAALLETKRLLIFDLDGTLADSSPLHALAFTRVLQPHGVGVDYPAIAGMKTLDAMQQCLGGAGIVLAADELAGLVQAKQRHVRELIRQELLPLPGADAFLRWARPRYRLAMYSSGSRGTVGMALAKLGYEGWFEPMLCAEDVRCAKPDPEGYLQVLALAGATAAEALVFEDSDAGLLAAQRAGIATLDVRPPSFYDRLVPLAAPPARGAAVE